MNAILYNFAHSKKGFSGEIEYFYEFAVFEGFISNWAEMNGYSDLWDSAIATSEEQTELQNEMRKLFGEWISSKTNWGKNEESKINQLKAFKESTFPNPKQRNIRRSLKKRFLDYFDKRLPDDIKRNEVVNYIKKYFHQIYSRRNEIGHSLEKYSKSPHYKDDTVHLTSIINLISNFELMTSLNGEHDWKFTPREIDLTGILTNRSIDKIEILSDLSFDDSDCILACSDGEFRIHNLEYKSGFYFDNGKSMLEYKKELILRIKERMHSLFYSPSPTGGKVIEIVDESCYVRPSSTEKSYCIKMFSKPSSFTSNSSDFELNISKIQPEYIKTIFLLENCEFDEFIYSI